VQRAKCQMVGSRSSIQLYMQLKMPTPQTQ